MDIKQVIKHHLAFFMIVFIDYLIFVFPAFVFGFYLLLNPQLIDLLKEGVKNNLIACFIAMYASFEFWHIEQKKVFPKLRRLMSIKYATLLDNYKLPFILKIIIHLCMIFCTMAILSKILFAAKCIVINGIINSEILILSIMSTLVCAILYYFGYWLPPLIGYLKKPHK